MNARVKRVTVRAYNLRPGDVMVNTGHIVESTVLYPGTVFNSWVDIAFTNNDSASVNPDTLMTVTRNYAY